MLGLMVDLNPEFIYYLLLLSVLCRRTADCGASVAVTVVSADMLPTLCKTVLQTINICIFRQNNYWR